MTLLLSPTLHVNWIIGMLRPIGMMDKAANSFYEFDLGTLTRTNRFSGSNEFHFSILAKQSRDSQPNDFQIARPF